MTKDEALRLAREALYSADSLLGEFDEDNRWREFDRNIALAAIDAALAEPDYEAPERRCGGPGCDGNCCMPAEHGEMPELPKSVAIAVLNRDGMPLPEPAHTTDQMRAYGRACAEAARNKTADRIEELELELAICREAIEVAYEVVYNDWPKKLDDDSDMAVRRCTLRRLQEAVGKAAPRLLGEAPEGQRMYGLHYRDLVEQRKADEELMRLALEALRSDATLRQEIDAIAALRERLGERHEINPPSATPPAREPVRLTDEDIIRIVHQVMSNDLLARQRYALFARAVEDAVLRVNGMGGRDE